MRVWVDRWTSGRDHQPGQYSIASLDQWWGAATARNLLWVSLFVVYCTFILFCQGDDMPVKLSFKDIIFVMEVRQ